MKLLQSQIFLLYSKRVKDKEKRNKSVYLKKLNGNVKNVNGKMRPVSENIRFIFNSSSRRLGSYWHEGGFSSQGVV